jgi:hypothetical protein
MFTLRLRHQDYYSASLGAKMEFLVEPYLNLL